MSSATSWIQRLKSVRISIPSVRQFTAEVQCSTPLLRTSSRRRAIPIFHLAPIELAWHVTDMFRFSSSGRRLSGHLQPAELRDKQSASDRSQTRLHVALLGALFIAACSADDGSGPGWGSGSGDPANPAANETPSGAGGNMSGGIGGGDMSGSATDDGAGGDEPGTSDTNGGGGNTSGSGSDNPDDGSGSGGDQGSGSSDDQPGTGSSDPDTPGGQDPGTGTSVPGASVSGSPIVPARIRRLSNLEYGNSVRALLQTTDAYETTLPTDVRQRNFTANQAQTVSSDWNAEIERTARAAAAGVVQSGGIDRISPCPGQATDDCAAQFITSFATQAFRRAVADVERDGLLDIYQQGAAEGGFERGIELVIAAVLQAPSFIYISELGADAGGQLQLTGDEIATLLAYVTTQSSPDESLLEALTEVRAGQVAMSSELAFLLATDRELAALAPEGIDVYIDLVGGEHQRVLDPLGVRDLRALAVPPAAVAACT